MCSYCMGTDVIKHACNPIDGKHVYGDDGKPWMLCKRCMSDFLLAYQIEAAFADRLSLGESGATFVNKGDGEWEKIG